MMKSKAEILAHAEALIARHGWMVQSVFASSDEPGFAYTVGLAGKGLPELIVFNLPPPTATAILNNVARRLVEEPSLARNEPISEILEKLPVVLIDAERAKADRYMFAAANRAPHYKALQVVWPDMAGRFPWEADYDRRRDFEQPLLWSAS